MSRKRVKFDTRNEVDPDKVVEIGKRKKFHPQDLVSLSPKNKNQADFLTAYYSQIPFIVQSGCAGTGKTTMALYAAFSEVFDPSTPYDKVIVLRSAVETRKQGFLPGTQEEKNAPFEEPYRQVASDILKFKDPYDNLKALGQFEFYTTGHLRGRTFYDCVLIIDEVQNFERQELLTALTRCGTNSRIIVCGDSKQDDVSDRNHTSAFRYLQALINNMPSHSSAHISYKIEDCLRSGIVKDILIADSFIPDNF